MTDQTQHTDDPMVHAHVARDFERNIARITSDLREMADRIGRVTAPPANRDTPGFGDAAGAVIADLMNMLPNLGLGMLARSAAKADDAILQFRLHDRIAAPAASAEGQDQRIIPGGYVRDAIDGDLGFINSVQVGGYGVIWELGGTPKFAAFDEVVYADPTEDQS